MNTLLTTFQVGDDLFALEVTSVQEVTGSPIVVPVPLGPAFVRGLINLRGQLATALELRELFCLTSEITAPPMSVVCRVDGNLVSLLVDRIGDVVPAEEKNFEPAPDTMPPKIRQYVKGVFKMQDGLLSVLDLERIAKELSPQFEVNAA